MLRGISEVGLRPFGGRTMPRFRFPAIPTLALFLPAVLLLSSCGDGIPNAPLPPGRQQDPDIVALSIDGGAETTYVEASGAPAIACDPRVDWFLYQVVCYSHHTNGSGPNGYDFFFGFLFPLMDGVGTYTVQGDKLEAHFYYNGTRYLAHPNVDTSDGTVTVTRSDDRIDGTFSVTVVEYQGTTTLPLTGHFSVHSGYSTSCP